MKVLSEEQKHSRNDDLRNMCVEPEQYDRLIEAIKNHNPYCLSKDTPLQQERFAVHAVNHVISSILFEKKYMINSGMAVGIKVGSKVYLALAV